MVSHSTRIFLACLLWTMGLMVAPPSSLSTYSQIIFQDYPAELGDPSGALSREPKWAYAFVVAGINPDKPTYRGFLYNIAISAHIFQQQGSQADVVVLLQLENGYQQLPPQDERLLQGSNIRLHYLPPLAAEKSFFQVNLQKFATLTLTQYTRVLYLDSDIMPFCNLDYLFQLSEDGVLKENVIMATYGEPANGGFWMITPREGDLERLQQVLTATALRTVEAGVFNHTRGWGHVMGQEEHDVARMTNDRNVSIWYWYASNADQGLLYQWMKYEQQQVSILIGDEVEQWGPGPQYQGRFPKLLDNYTCLPPHANQQGHYAHSVTANFVADSWVPYRDFRHFWANLKPWNVLKDYNLTLEEMMQDKTYNIQSPWEATDAELFWWSMLKEVVQANNLTTRPLPAVVIPNKQHRNATRIPTGHYYAATVMRHYLDSINVSYVWTKPP